MRSNYNYNATKEPNALRHILGNNFNQDNENNEDEED
jgi:hypothetical protein